jgi:hypothetical protein
MSELLRVYAPEECGEDGYPYAWHRSIKTLVREQAGNRCLRCRHPYEKGDGEWSECDINCQHGGPVRYRFGDEDWCDFGKLAERDGWVVDPQRLAAALPQVQARYRILTTHHLNGVKPDCRWWNLVPLCQRCHLLIQRKVVMNRPWPWEHTDWFQPYAAAFYAFKYLQEDLRRVEVMARQDELLTMGQARESEERMPI